MHLSSQFKLKNNGAAKHPFRDGGAKILNLLHFQFQTFNRAWKSQIEQNVRWL